ncbi:hypothetical protein HMI54_004716 [Coelomomyces lativittatus]|nr:hypothetical protein HMI56_005232 [Coelomomyces lativittatus]KAJ1506889.1 hypothetical protein HMI54_004716 [Coelomomyces lativittatus]
MPGTTPTHPTPSSSSPSSSSSLVPLPSHYFSSWFMYTVHLLSQCLFWPFIGGIMYGIGEVTAREFLARKFGFGGGGGVPPSVPRFSSAWKR